MYGLGEHPDLWPPVGLSAEEQLATHTLWNSVYACRFFVESWSAALALHMYARRLIPDVPRALANKWKFTAAHECVMQIAFLGEHLEIIRADRLRPCKTVLAHLDRSAMKKSSKLFSVYFPNITPLRNAIAHQGYVGASPEKHKPKHETYALVGFRENDERYEAIYEGQRYHLDINGQTLEKLAEIVTIFWSAFRPVEQAFDRMGRLAE